MGETRRQGDGRGTHHRRQAGVRTSRTPATHGSRASHLPDHGSGRSEGGGRRSRPNRRGPPVGTRQVPVGGRPQPHLQPHPRQRSPPPCPRPRGSARPKPPMPSHRRSGGTKDAYRHIHPQGRAYTHGTAEKAGVKMVGCGRCFLWRLQRRTRQKCGQVVVSNLPYVFSFTPTGEWMSSEYPFCRNRFQ